MKAFLLLVCLLSLLSCKETLEVKSSDHELVTIEQQFADYCSRYGLPAAWIHFFDPHEGIMFSPDPVLAVEYMIPKAKRASTSQISLVWKPLYSYTNKASDFGFNMGPSVFEMGDNKRNRGYFFSVWHKYDNEWKVLLDLGTEFAGPDYEHRLQVEPIIFDVENVAQPKLSKAYASEKQFVLHSQNDFYAALSDNIDSNSICLFDGLAPLQGLQDFSNTREMSLPFSDKISFSTLDKWNSASGDFFVVYGDFVDFENMKSGYFIRVWVAGVDGRWRVASQTMAARSEINRESVIKAHNKTLTRSSFLSHLDDAYALHFNTIRNSGIDKQRLAEMLKWDFALNTHKQLLDIYSKGDTVVFEGIEKNDFTSLIGFPGWHFTSKYWFSSGGKILGQVYSPSVNNPNYKEYLEPAIEWLESNQPVALAEVYDEGKIVQDSLSATRWVELLQKVPAAEFDRD